MRINLEPTNRWRLHNAPFAFQQTYRTPLSDLRNFVHALLAPFDFHEAIVKIETIVFNPEGLLEYLQTFNIATNEGELNRASLHAESRFEAELLLEHTLGEWIDFAFLPSPETFAVYADHDEYTTVFTATEEALSSLHVGITNKGFKAVDDWTWTGPHSPGTIEESNTNV